MAQNDRKIKHVSREAEEVVSRIMSGTTEQAEGILRRVKGYKPIPGIDMMTTPMIRKLIRNINTQSINNYAAHNGIPRIKGKWESNTAGIVSISEYLREAGIACDPSEGMKMVGCGPRNSRVNLFDPKGVLAILYMFKSSRERIESKVKEVYFPELAVTEVLPAEAPTTEVTGFAPEFISAAAQAFAREVFAAMLKIQQEGVS